MFLVLGFIIGFIVCCAFNSNKTTKKSMPVYIEDDVAAIRRLKEIEFWQNFGNDK